MANNLTGDWEAVVQVGVRQINGLLATLHQNSVREDAKLTLLHSATLRVGDPPRKFPDVTDFGDWVLEYHRTHAGVKPGDLPGHLTTTAPPGAAGRMKDVFSRFGLEAEIPPDVVRGKVRVQISSPVISLPTGSTSEVTVHAHVRAHYTPDPGTTDLPQPVHGELQATYELHLQTIPGRPPRRRLVIRPSAQDSKINFIPAPGSGMDPVEASRISAEVRKVVRGSIELLPVDLKDFPFGGFKGLGSGAGQALALPLQLSDAAAPASGLQSVSNVFLGTGGFAFGIGREFVISVFQPTIVELEKFKQVVPVNILGGTADYQFSVTKVELQFNAGTIDLIIRGKATHWFWQNYENIVIRQRLSLLMLNGILGILAFIHDPEVSGVPGSAVGRIKNTVIVERERHLPPAQDAFNEQLSDAKRQLNDALSSIEPSSSASFRAGFSEDPAAATSGGVAITSDGVIVRGDIGTTTARAAPHVEITEIEPGRSYSALNSWIPGGRIERLVWSWVEGSLIAISRGQVKTHPPDEHRFLLSIPPPQPGTIPVMHGVSRVCLRLEGSRTLADGSVQPVAGGDTCRVGEPDILMNVPSWWEPVTVPIWMPDVANGVIARDAIAAHVTVQSDTPRNQFLSRNTLVYFADWNSDAPLAVVADALTQVRRKNYALGVIVVLPPGVFDRRREELERRLESAQARIPAQLLLTEDDEGGWTRTFAPAKVPSIYLINARREFVWQHEGDPEPKDLAAALDKLLVPAPAPQSRPALALTVSPGERALDAKFADGGHEYALHRLRGRNVLLNFWQSWSAPCLKELRRLQSLQKPASGGREPAGEAPFIVAFHGGKDNKALDTVRKELGLSFLLVQDSHQRIARTYGVRCWPTTVTIGGDGIVQRVQFGLSTEYDAAPLSDKYTLNK